jgi:hypothetical protein
MSQESGSSNLAGCHFAADAAMSRSPSANDEDLGCSPTTPEELHRRNSSATPRQPIRDVTLCARPMPECTPGERGCVVKVRGYRRSDGTYVRPHFRGAQAKAATAGVAVSVCAVFGFTVGLPGGGASAPGGGGTARPPARQAEAKAKAEVDFKRITVRLNAKGYRVNLRAAQESDCAAHSYGEVKDFFRSSPCDLLSRAVLELRDKRKNVILVAVSRVDMPSVADAKRYKRLVDKSGTGNVTELSRETGPYRQVRYTGDLYTSNINGVTVRNTQVQPVGWSPGVRILQEINRNTN